MRKQFNIDQVIISFMGIGVLIGLTIAGFGGITLDFIDQWTDAPKNQIKIFWFLTATIGLTGFYWFGHWMIRKWKER